MIELKRKKIGTSDISVTELGLGTGTLGNLYREVSDNTALETVAAAWNAGFRYFDTAPFYGLGLSEIRVGHALSGRSRANFTLSTQVGTRLVAAEPVT